MSGKRALAAALKGGGASSSSIRDVQHPSGKGPLPIQLQEEYERVKLEGYVCPGYPECENMDCDCEGPESEEEQGECGAADWKEDLRNWETMGDDPPETEVADVKESDEEDKEKGKEEELYMCGRCLSGEAHNCLFNKAKEKEEGGKGSGTTGARPNPSKRWKMLLPSNFPRRPQPYENNFRRVPDKVDFVWTLEGFRVRKGA